MFEHAEDKGYFPGLLEIILVHPSSLALPTVMLQAVSSPSLVCVTVEVDGGMIRAQGVEDIFTILASRTGNSLIREVKVSVPLNFLKPGDVFTFDAIEPLLTLPELTSVIVGGFEHYAIDDYALLAMATAWPHIRQLSTEAARHACRTGCVRPELPAAAVARTRARHEPTRITSRLTSPTCARGSRCDSGSWPSSRPGGRASRIPSRSRRSCRTCSRSCLRSRLASRLRKTCSTFRDPETRMNGSRYSPMLCMQSAGRRWHGCTCRALCR